MIVNRLRAGELFMMHWPNFHAISADLISIDEMQSLLGKLPQRKFFKYAFATTGYHLMWNLARRATRMACQLDSAVICS